MNKQTMTPAQAEDIRKMREYAIALSHTHAEATDALRREHLHTLAILCEMADRAGNAADNLYDEILDRHAPEDEPALRQGDALWYDVAGDWFRLAARYAQAIKDMAHDAGVLPEGVEL